MNETHPQGGRVLPTRRGRIRSTVSLLALSLGITSAVIASPPSTTRSLNPIARFSKLHFFQIGRASWYGRGFQGKRTANGETFDMNDLTCAHRTLPMGSWLRVTNLLNRKVAYVRVNDRGPVPETRVIDLSYAAAKKLGIGGTAKVRLDEVPVGEAQTVPSVMNSSDALLMASLKPIDTASLFREMPGMPVQARAVSYVRRSRKR